MSQWLVPALVAPLVLGLVTVGGWFVTYVLGMRQERLRRLERVIDVQTALAAEIRGYLARGAGLNFAEHGRRMADWIMAGDGRNTPFVPLEPDFLVYPALVKDIHILPEPAIDPVVLFYAQAATVALLAKDLRADRYQTLDPASKVEVYQDYLAIMDYAFQLARQALLALQESQQDERIQ